MSTISRRPPAYCGRHAGRASQAGRQEFDQQRRHASSQTNPQMAGSSLSESKAVSWHWQWRMTKGCRAIVHGRPSHPLPLTSMRNALAWCLPYEFLTTGACTQERERRPACSRSPRMVLPLQHRQRAASGRQQQGNGAGEVLGGHCRAQHSGAARTQHRCMAGSGRPLHPTHRSLCPLSCTTTSLPALRRSGQALSSQRMWRLREAIRHHRMSPHTCATAGRQFLVLKVPAQHQAAGNRHARSRQEVAAEP